MITLKQIGVAAALAVIANNPAYAADLGGKRREPVEHKRPVNVEQMPAPWQGFYAGLTLGTAHTIVDVDKVGTHRDLSGHSAGFGLMAGYNFANGPWVWGVEGDLARHGVSKKPHAVTGLGDVSGDHGSLGSVRLRGGYVWNDVLFYGTAGVALTSIDVKSSLGGKAELSTGSVIGLGAEWAFDKVWTARLEGLAYGFGTDDTLAGAKRDVGLATSTLRLGVARRF